MEFALIFPLSTFKFALMKYGIFGLRGAGDRVYFCSDTSQGERFVPFADSFYAKFETKREAKAKLDKLEKNWLGLKLFVFQDI